MKETPTEVHLKYIRDSLDEMKEDLKQVPKNKEAINKVNFKINSVGSLFSTIWVGMIAYFTHKS